MSKSTEKWIRVNACGLQDHALKVVAEDDKHYTVIVDGKREMFYKEKCVIDRRKQTEANASKLAKAKSIGLNKKK